ncbi:MAG: IMP dehydrogenase [Patescibacteria group bacterium]|nr:IMP dehydrogenase [Patescibacteria group bacterium]
MQEALTFDDILLTPRYSNILPSDVNTESKLTRNISVKIPIISSPMDTVTEHQMAIAMALEGGIGIIHRNLSIERQAEEVRLVKRFENGFIKDPVTVSPDDDVDIVHRIAEENGYKKVPVIDKKGMLLGIVTELYYIWPEDKSKKVRSIMKPVKDLVLAREPINLSRANEIIKNEKLSVLCVTDRSGKLRSIVTRKDLEKNKDYPLATKDKDKRLRVGAALGTGNDLLDRARAVAGKGADVLVIDTAHGHSKNVIEAIKILKKDKVTKQIDVVAGNVATKEAVRDLIKAGADAVKIGIGPGSICTTRIVTGVGVPQITAIMETVKGRGKNTQVPLIADGGIKYSGDIVKALAIKADSIMLGGLLAGTEESPGETLLAEGKMYKAYRGMGSLGAMEKGSKDRYGQAGIKDSGKFVPEGIEGRTLYRGPVCKTLHQLVGGLKSGMGYLGARTIKQLQQKACPVKITSSGRVENHPHDVTITKEAPNYQNN